jgi:hypothetical protein
MDVDGRNARMPLRNVPSHTTVTHFSALIHLPLDGSFVELSDRSPSTLSSLYITTDPNHAGNIFAKPKELFGTKKVIFDAQIGLRQPSRGFASLYTSWNETRLNVPNMSTTREYWSQDHSSPTSLTSRCSELERSSLFGRTASSLPPTFAYDSERDATGHRGSRSQ